MSLKLLMMLSLALLLASCKSEQGRGSEIVAVARTEIPLLDAPLVESAGITADGVLSEAAWRRAASTGGFVDRQRRCVVADSPVTARLMTWDAQALYFAVRVLDDEPTSPFARDDVDPTSGKPPGHRVMIQPGDRVTIASTTRSRSM
jgi:hypothetical protein